MRFRQKYVMTLVATIAATVIILVSLLCEKELTMPHVYLLSTIFVAGIGGNVAAKASQGLGDFFSNKNKEKP